MKRPASTPPNVKRALKKNAMGGYDIPSNSQQLRFYLLSASIKAPASMPNSPVSVSFTTLAVRPAADDACGMLSCELAF